MTKHTAVLALLSLSFHSAACEAPSTGEQELEIPGPEAIDVALEACSWGLEVIDDLETIREWVQHLKEHPDAFQRLHRRQICRQDGANFNCGWYSVPEYYSAGALNIALYRVDTSPVTLHELDAEQLERIRSMNLNEAYFSIRHTLFGHSKKVENFRKKHFVESGAPKPGHDRLVQVEAVLDELALASEIAVRDTRPSDWEFERFEKLYERLRGSGVIEGIEKFCALYPDAGFVGEFLAGSRPSAESKALADPEYNPASEPAPPSAGSSESAASAGF